ncbi:MAG: hypothetical protein AB7Q97_18940 [Gammaproteobacteria bacterium]
MGKKFTIDEFKQTFDKPATPKGASKQKDTLEDIAKEMTAKKDERRADTFKSTAAEIYKDHADYYVELLGYKLAKHWDDKSRKVWLERSPAEASEKVLDKLYTGRKWDEDAINGELESSPSHVIVDYLEKRQPALVRTAAKKKFAELDGAKLEEYGTKLPFAAKTDLLKEGLAKKDAKAVKACIGAFAFLTEKQQQDYAEADPDFFVTNVFPVLHESGDNALNMLKKPKWREILSQDQAAWKKLTDSMPILSVSVAAKKRTNKDDPTPKEMTEAIFDCVCLNDGVQMTYFTNPVDTDHALLGGPSETDTKARTDQVSILKNGGYEEPDKPATQCHNLKGIVKQMVQLSLGDKVRIEDDHIDYMLLTKPMSQMPGGLLPKTFGGNVRDDSGKLTGQVMFTGVGGTHSHTWLRIDGVDYDPVLGTRGAAVKNSKADEFKWVVPELVGKGTGGDYIIKDPQLKPAPNKHGFGTCYRLTKKPEDYIGGIYGLALDVSGTEIKVKEVFANGPCNGVLEKDDVILKVNDGDADPSLLHDYVIGNQGEKRKFKVRRANKTKKFSVKAVSPLSMDG